MSWPEWAGDIPIWITTLAIAVAAGQFFIERNRRSAEREREAKAQATKISSWVAKVMVTDASPETKTSAAVKTSRRSPDVCGYDPENHSRYGIVVLNSSESTFHDVKITVRIGDYGVEEGQKSGLEPVKLRVLPPGKSFIPLMRSNHGWAWANGADEYEEILRPLTQTPSYRVLSMAFTDNLEQRWLTNEHAVLSRA